MAFQARPIAVLATATLVALLLAGCTGNAVTVSGQGYTSGSQSKSIDCEETAHLARGKQGTGKMTVTVTDGAGRTVHSSSKGLDAGQDADAVSLQGESGTWTLKVSTGLGYAGQWAVTLSC